MCAVALSGGHCAPAVYLDNISAAIDALEGGRTADCVRSVRQAFVSNANDTLGHVTLGMALLCGRRPEDAMMEFNAALALDKKCAAALYGKALVHLSEKRLDFAATALGQAQAVDPTIDTQAELAYIEALKSGTYAFHQNADGNPLWLSMNAICLMSRERHAEARTIWENGLTTSGYGFRERPGCAITFLRSGPVSIGGVALSSYSKEITARKPAIPTVSDTIMLRADLSRATSVTMVLFFVDDRLVGITNTRPFEYAWDTSRVANGQHTIKIQGSGSDSLPVSEKSAQVIVKNAGGPAPSALVTGKEADALWRRLWGALRLKTSLASANYNLATCALKTGDKEEAKAALERVLAADPDYLDAADRLAWLYQPTGLANKIYSVPMDKKIIALTFDDGPKARTVQLLDLLDAKKVKATFFVVGKMAAAEPRIVARMVQSGHELANHTYNHQDLEYLSAREITQELFRNAALIRSVTRRDGCFIRPPGAHMGERLSGVLKKFGMTVVMWTANCSKLEGTTSKKISDYVISSAKPGGIILMHNPEGVTLGALPTIINTLTARGYRFVTLTELTIGGQKNAARTQEIRQP